MAFRCGSPHPPTPNPCDDKQPRRNRGNAQTPWRAGRAKLSLLSELRFDVTPQTFRRCLTRQLFRKLDPQLDLFNLPPALRARDNVLRKLSRGLSREFSVTVS